MKRRLNTELGFYSPSFLRMHIGTTKSLINLGAIGEDLAESLYLHEYVHYIQDLTTNYGLMNLVATVDYMKFVNNYVISLPQGNFKVPVIPVPNSPDNVYANLLLFKIYNGSGDDDYVVLKAHRKLQSIVPAGSKNLPVPYIEVDYEVKSVSKTFEFGAICILENMAYIIESECYPNCAPSPDLPYSSAEKLVNLIFPQFGQNRLNVLALCDASLKHPHPGPFFYDTLLLIKTNNIQINQPEDVYKVCNQAAINFQGVTTFNGLFQVMANQAISQLLGYFNDPNFQPLKDWLENMVKEAVAYRIQNETFPLDIARAGKMSVNQPLGTCMQRFGTPLVTNDAGETTLSDPRPRPSTPNYATIWALDQIHSVFWGEKTSCELIRWCQSAGLQTDIRCTKEPWQRNLLPTCAFGQMWRHWALTGYKPV